MNKTYMVTIPYDVCEPFSMKGSTKGCVKRVLKLFIDKHDIHKYTFGLERGKHGRRHIQGRFRIGDGTEFKTMHEELLYSHLEEASDSYDYERKEGNYWTSEDTNEIRKVRFGQPRKWQINLMQQLDKQGDREVLILVDAQGNHGKSWLCNYMYERGRAYYVPPTIDTVKGLIQFVASGYNKEEYIFIDIPRSWKWSQQLYATIETIKDGLVYDTRYNARLRNIRGVKILVMSNTMPKLDKLSVDRWRVYTVEGDEVCPFTVTLDGHTPL